jgi:hypothetical protein
MIRGCSIPVCSMCQHASRHRFSFSELFLDYSTHPLGPQEKTSAGLKLWNETVKDEWVEPRTSPNGPSGPASQTVRSDNTNALRKY